MSETALPATPYKGLMPYSEEDAPFFFGREAEREIITANLMASRLTLLYGASGVGKTSVLRAGVAYHLRQLARQNLAERGTPEFTVVVFSSWRDDPIVGLTDRVRDSVAQALETRFLRENGFLSTPPRALTQTLQAWSERVGGDLLIILDQFEEYFLYNPQEDGEGTFAVEFPRAVNRPDLRVSFLVSIREDSLAKLDRFKGRIPNLFDNYLRVEHLDREAARAAIEKPIEQYNRLRAADDQPISIEPTLVDAVLEQVRTGQVVLGEAGRGIVGRGLAPTQIETPYLQLVMTRLWDEEMRTGSPVLRLATLERLGGAERIVRTHLDAVMSGLPPNEQDTAVRVFYHLVTPSGTKIAHTAPDLAEFAGLPPTELAPVLEKLSGPEVRILRPVAPPPDRPQAPRYEIFHDVLAPAVLDWRARFVQAQERAEAEKQLTRDRRRVTRLRLGLIGLSLLLMVMVVLAISAFQQRDAATRAQAEANAQRATAVDQRDAAEKAKAEAVAQQKIALSRQLAAQALNHLGDQLDRALLLSIEAYRTSDTLEARSSLLTGLQYNPYLTTFLHGHTAGVSSLAFSSDGRTLASGSWDNRLILWDIATHQPLGQPLTGHANAVYSVAFSPDGKVLASGSCADYAGGLCNQGEIRLWDAVARQPRGSPLTGHESVVSSVAYSPNGKMLASGSHDNTVILWDVANGQPIGKPLTGHKSWVVSVAFSLDGKTLASGSWDSTIRLWDVATGRPIGQPLTGHANWLTSVAFSPDGKMLASGSSDDTIRLWDVATGRPIGQPLTGHKHLVNSVAFSPDGKTLASGSRDRTIILWNVATRQPIGQPLSGHPNEVFSVAFSPDGNTFASGDRNGTIVLWNLANLQPLGQPLATHLDPISSVIFTPDGRSLVSLSGKPLDGKDESLILWNVKEHRPTSQSSIKEEILSLALSPSGEMLATSSRSKRKEETTIILWNVTTGQPIGLPLTSQRGFVESLTFSQDGRTLASGNEDGTIILWAVATYQPLGRPLARHTEEISSLAFSPDGKTLASGSWDRTIRLWDVPTGQPIGQPLTGHIVPVTSMAFSPDRQTLASSSFGKTSQENVIILWDIATWQMLGTPLTGQRGVTSIAFSPDSQMLALANADGTVILLDVVARRPLGSLLTGREASVNSVAFSPTGKTLASGSDDGMILLWDVSAESWITRACGRANRNLTLEERQQFLGDESYRKTCPNLP